MEKQLGYQDISLKPQMCMVESRKECDTKVTLGSRVSVITTVFATADPNAFVAVMV